MSHTKSRNVTPCGLTSTCLRLFALFVVLILVEGQNEFMQVPDIPKALRESDLANEISSFYKIWELSESDTLNSNIPSVRLNIEPKTILALSENAYLHLIPQDISDPFLRQEKESPTLRKTFLKNHLMLDAADPNDPQINTKEGLQMETLSGKTLVIKRDANKQLIIKSGEKMSNVNFVGKLLDESFIYQLQQPLFDTRALVTNAVYRGAIGDALGPPLDLSIHSQAGRIPQPPAPPPQEPRFSAKSGIFPPAPPPEFMAPQGPGFSHFKFSAPHPQEPRFSPKSGIFPPAPPEFMSPKGPLVSGHFKFEAPAPPNLHLSRPPPSNVRDNSPAQVRQEQRSGRRA